jgi:hypothetical protein
VSEQDDLVERFSTPRSDLDPALRRRLEAQDSYVRRLEAVGRIAAPHPMLDDGTVPGLDHTNGYRPFPVERSRRPSDM